jgi:hypothetical protein
MTLSWPCRIPYGRMVAFAPLPFFPFLSRFSSLLPCWSKVGLVHASWILLKRG